VIAALTAVAALSLLALAWELVRTRRKHAEETAQLKERLRGLSERLDQAQRQADEAVTRTEVAGHLLLEKGIADEEELEAARALLEGPDGGDDPSSAGGRTVH
jgi:hypothetical protein